MIPIARPLLDETEAEAAKQAVLSGWVTQGPEVAAFERDFADAVDAASRLRRVQLHDRPSSRTACGRGGCGRRGRDGQSLLHRDRQRDTLLRRAARLRRHRPGHLQPRPGRVAAGHHGADQGHPVRPPDGHALRSGAHPGDRRARTACRSSRTPRARSARRYAWPTPGSGSASRTATSPVSRSIRGRF